MWFKILATELNFKKQPSERPNKTQTKTKHENLEMRLSWGSLSQLAFKFLCHVLLSIYCGYGSCNSSRVGGQRWTCLSGRSTGILWAPPQRRKAALQAWLRALSGEPSAQPFVSSGFVMCIRVESKAVWSKDATFADAASTYIVFSFFPNLSFVKTRSQRAQAAFKLTV